MVHTEHLGVRGDGEGVDVGQVALVLHQTTSRDHQDERRGADYHEQEHTQYYVHVCIHMYIILKVRMYLVLHTHTVSYICMHFT